MARSRKERRFALQASSVLAPAALCIAGEAGPLEIQAAEGEAKLKRFSMTAYTGGAMRLNGWPYPVVVELTGMKVPSQNRPIFKDHDSTQIIGHSETVEISSQRLRLSGVISGVGDAAQEVVQLAANGFPWQSSIGADPDKVEFLKEGDKANVNGKAFTGPLYIVRSSVLGEVSFVPRGADHNATAKVAAKQGEQTMNPFEKWLQAKGIDAATLSEPAKAALEAAFKMESTPPPAPPPAPEKKKGTVAEITAAARREDERQNAISEIVAAAIEGVNGEAGITRIEAAAQEAIDKGWDLDRSRQAIELAGIYARKPNAPAIIKGRNEEMTGEVIEAAICASGGLPSLEKSFKPEVLEAADKRLRGLTLHGMLRLAAQRHNWRGAEVKADLKNVWDLAMRRPEIQAAGPSTFSVPGILGNVANKFFRDAFMFVDQTWRQVAAIGSVNDFKAITTYSLTGSMKTAQLAPGGKLEHKTVSELSYSNQADTYGSLFGIDRRDLVNDDLGAFTRITSRMGRGAALSFNTVFWTAFLADASTFWTSARGNFDDGASDTLLDLTGLANADSLFKLQTDPDGELLGATPRILLVPTALSAQARVLMSSMLLIDGTATAAQGNTNIWQGRYTPVETPYLQNTAITGNSNKAWYLLADPNDIPVIEVVFLNGQQMPIIETADMDFDRLGTSFRVYHDFGVTKQEYRGGVKMKGEN